jgi:hypothetical protein
MLTMYEAPSALSISFRACILKTTAIRSAIEQPEKNPENNSKKSE